MITIRGSVSGLLVDVDASKNLTVNLPYDTPAEVAQGGGIVNAGFAVLAGEADPGFRIGERQVRAVEVTRDFRTRVGTDVTMLNQYFPGAALNSTIWTAPTTTSTISVAGNLLTLNNGASLAANAVARVTSYRSFPVYVTFPLYTTMFIQFSAVPVPNSVHEWGMFISTGTTAPTDGVLFRINLAGELRAIVNTGGVETQSAAIDFNALVGVNTSKQFLVAVGTDMADFWIDNECVASIPAPAALGAAIASGQLPVSFRSYNAAAVTGTACLMRVSAVNVTLGEMNNSKAWSHVLAGSGGTGYQGQTGATLGSTALYTNSLGPTAGAAMTNTTAALGAGLGGQFSALPTLAINNDGIISSFQVPVGTAALPGASLYITGISVYAMVTVALAGGAVNYAYSAAFGHTAVSLATTTTATSKAPVRKVLGLQTFAAAAPVGTIGTPIEKDFDRAPIVVHPGEFFQIVAKNLGTVTTAGVITFFIDIESYWE